MSRSGEKQAQALVVALALALPGARAGDAKPLTLTGPEVAKLSWNTRALQAADVDGDGRRDLLVIDNERAEIEILYQLDPKAPLPPPPASLRPNRWEPVLEDARYRRVGVSTGAGMFDLATGDLNGDGRLDLVYTCAPQDLKVRYQQKDGGWEEKKVPDAPEPLAFVSGLRVADLNGDGRADIVLLGTKELAIFYQDAKGELGVPVRFPLPEENCYGLKVFDLDGDGRNDLVYLSAASHDAIRVRRQNAAGRFGAEESYEIKPASSTLQVLAPAKSGRGAVLAYADSQGGKLEQLRIQPRKGEAGEVFLRPRSFAPRTSGKAALSYALGDFDGDGRVDVAAADPDGAQVFIYFRQADGGFTEAKAFPSLAEVKSIAACDWDGDGKADVFVASPREQIAGVASMNAEGRLVYPQPLPSTGRPLAIAAGNLATDGCPAVVVLREDKGKRACEIIERRAGGPAITRTVEIAGVKTDPRGVALFDVNQDGLSDLVVMVPLDTTRVYLQQHDGSFADASAAEGYRKSLLDRVDLAAIAAGDLDGDGRDEMLVAGGGFARGLKIDAKGALVVTDQFNARDATTAEVTAALAVPAAKKGGRPAVVLYDRKGSQFETLRADDSGVYQIKDTIPAGKLEVVGSAARTDRNGTELFLFGKDGFWWLPIGRPELEAEVDSAYATDLPEIQYQDVIAGDFDGDGTAEIVAVDANSNLVEILGRAGESWRSLLHFKVFDTDEHFQGRRTQQPEPRETIVTDVTGDGKADLVLLVHDRVLVYPQQ